MKVEDKSYARSLAPPDGTHRRPCGAGFRQRGAGIRRIRTGWSRAASSTRLLKGAGCALAQTEGENPFAEPANLFKFDRYVISPSVCLRQPPSSSEEGRGYARSLAPPDGTHRRPCGAAAKSLILPSAVGKADLKSHIGISTFGRVSAATVPRLNLRLSRRQSA